MIAPLLTICSDASYSKETNIAAWACVIRAQGQYEQHHSLIHTQVRGATHAEQIGIAEALKIANSHFDLRKYHLLIVCDNMTAPMKRRERRKNLDDVQMHNAFYDSKIAPHLLKADGFWIHHVRGHQKLGINDVDMRSLAYMQDQCDRQARRIVRHEKKKRR